MEEQTIIRFNQVTKQFDQRSSYFNNVSFEIERGKFYTLLGLLVVEKQRFYDLLQALSNRQKGKYLFNDKIVNHIPANKRQVNTVFQDYALFPHLNVFENVAFGLRIKKMKQSVDY